jgi:hypothetical protein
MKYPLVMSIGLAFACGCGKSGADKFADSFCAEVAKCCDQLGYTDHGKMCNNLMSFAVMGGSYDSKAGDACLAEIKAQAAAGTFCSGAGPSKNCDAVFPPKSGNKKPGETCEFDSDCASSSQGEAGCNMTMVGSDWVGKCQVRMPGKAGDTPCLGTQDGDMFSSLGSTDGADGPAQGYVCNVADGVICKSGSCVALASEGTSCGSTGDCVRTAFCDYKTDKCTARLAAGAVCTGSDSAECMDGYYCPSGSPKQCTAQLAQGASCTDSDMCQSGNCSGGVCKAGFLDQMGFGLLCGSE